MRLSLLCFVLMGVCVVAQSPPSTKVIAGLFELTLTTLNEELGQTPGGLRSMSSGFRLAIEDINSNEDILPVTTLIPDIFDTQGTVSGSLNGLVNSDAEGISVVVGPSFSDQATISAVASGVYNILLASPSASEEELRTVSLYPLLVRAVPSNSYQSRILVDLVNYYARATGDESWREVGIISTADNYGVKGARTFTDLGRSVGIRTVAFQQFLEGATDVEVEVRELGNSEARVFISYMRASGYQTTIKEAHNQGLIGKYYVWICSDGCAITSAFFDQTDGTFLPAIRQLSLGYQGVVQQTGEGDQYERYLERWQSLDGEQYPGAGPGKVPNFYSLLTYEITIAASLALHNEFEKGNFNPTGLELYDSIRGIKFEGLTGIFELESNGDRRASYEIVNLWPNGEFVNTFKWDNETGLVPLVKTRWRDGTNNIPDLDVRTPFDYWSCHDKESGYDETGKLINLETPDGSDINFIKGSYECDQFIDCKNMSDEGYQCHPSFKIAFIIMGVFTGLLILLTCLLLPFICVFGCFVKRHRIFLSGTLFLLLLTIASIFGLFSTYAWYGKPQSFACNAQLWLFGVACVILTSSLLAKQIRLWRATSGTILFRKLSKSDKKGESSPIHPEGEFLIYFLILILFPMLIIILWTAFSTPGGVIREVDDQDHYICGTKGLTGPPGGIIFFYILLGYFALQLVSCFILGFLIRNVPRPFMDKRLMNISIFNLGFLTAVVVPVFMVLRFLSPFSAWLVRTFGIIYAFISTLFIHVVPKIVGLFLDKFQPNSGGGRGGPKIRQGSAVSDLDQSASASNIA